MWSFIVGKNENKEKPLLKKRFDEPFNVEFVSDMVSCVKLPDTKSPIFEINQIIDNSNRSYLTGPKC